MSAPIETIEGGLSAAGATPSRSVRRLFLEGGISLGLAVAVQRLFAFVTTALAARIGGVAVLGEYSLALSTAGMVGAFVGTGVGTVALRYVGQYPRSTHAYRKVLTLVAVITGVAALSSGLLLLFASRPLARIALDNPKLSGALQFAAAAVIVLILFEALNGVLVALNDFRSLLWLSVVSGVVLVLSVPYASHLGAKPMLVFYAAAFLTGIIVALVMGRKAIQPLRSEGGVEPKPPRAREVILFGNTQQFNTVVISVASWWVILLVTRQDPTLHQMGFYFVGSQLRQIAGQAPTLASQLVYPALSRVSAIPEQHDRVLSTATFFCAVLSFVPAGVVLIGMPWILKLYGLGYSGALITALILVATAVLQLSHFPVANALMMISLRAAALLNAIWSVALVLFAYLLIARYAAVGAALAWFLSQLVSQAVLFCLMKRLGRLPAGTLTTWLLADFAVLSVTGLAVLRSLGPNTAIGISAAQTFAFIAFLYVFLRIAQHRGYLPQDTRALIMSAKSVPAICLNSLMSLRRAES